MIKYKRYPCLDNTPQDFPGAIECTKENMKKLLNDYKGLYEWDRVQQLYVLTEYGRKGGRLKETLTREEMKAIFYDQRN